MSDKPDKPDKPKPPKQILQITEHTTLNARKMKYFKILYGDGTMAQLTKDRLGQFYLEGEPITEEQALKELDEVFHSRGKWEKPKPKKV